MGCDSCDSSSKIIRSSPIDDGLIPIQLCPAESPSLLLPTTDQRNSELPSATFVLNPTKIGSRLLFRMGRIRACVRWSPNSVTHGFMLVTQTVFRLLETTRRTTRLDTRRASSCSILTMTTSYFRTA